MAKGTRTIGTAGVPENREFDALWRRLKRLEDLVAGADLPLPVSPAPADVFQALVQIEVKETDSDPDLFVDGLELDQATGWAVSESGNLAKWSRAADTDTPTQTGTTSAAGTGQKQANVDHTHKRSIEVRKNSTGSDFIRRRLNLIEGTNVTLTVADDSGGDEVDVTITAASSAAASVGLQLARDRAYLYDNGSNLTLDAAYWLIGGVASGLVPGGITQYQYRVDGAILMGMYQNDWNIWRRLKLTVTNQPQTVNWGVPNVDDNLSVFREKPANASGTVTVAGGATAVSGSGTAFTTDFAVGDAIKFQDTGQVMHIASITDNTNLVTTHACRAVVAGNYRICKNVYVTSNQVAQSPVDQKSSFSLDVNGDWTIHWFFNNAHFQGAFNWFWDVPGNADVVAGDVGSETL